uniref:Uncharacterized protein n=1 Tax=Candidatus Kentrum sp. FW TaxID=2126338 RepID=A0A450S4S2_9GAMM|nr:MAG: hypothetical protein BECKFW1821B_GA0114236_100165 [Candidatus Kentron sp. FW]VFJ49010.1 MAG: hypothetical protein BECKFW1821A_GA0114235_102131 [Candidatus Kentron sp. FW]
MLDVWIESAARVQDHFPSYVIFVLKSRYYFPILYDSAAREYEIRCSLKVLM